MTTVAKKYFFTVFHPEKHSERMAIPNAFFKSTRLQGRRDPEDVFLRNVSGRVWRVKARVIERKFYFEKGWKVFQEENCLGKEDIIVFKYDGSNSFKVVILEASSRCEKKEAVEDAGEVIEITDEEEHEKVEDSMTEEEDEDEEDNEDEDYAEMDEKSEEHSAGYRTSQTSRRACKRESASSSIPMTEGPHLQDYEFDPQMHIQQENPYFEAKLYKNRPNELHVPANVIKELSLTFPEKITLSRCQCFQREDIPRNGLRDYHFGLPPHTPIYSEVAKVSEWQDGRVCIKGWTTFCTKNMIKENDVCICEIISGEDGIVRAFWVHVLGARNR